MKVVLASKSPRRKELLKLLDLSFEVITADIDEALNTGSPVCDEVARLSFEKAHAVSLKTDIDDIIISADTIVELNGKAFGKPKTAEEAHLMLKALSNNTHRVLTGITVMQGKKFKTRVVTTSVTFRPISDKEISDYISTGEPMDKAGAYGIQGRASKFVSRIEGDYFSVVGLPVCTLSEMLNDFKLSAAAD